MFEKRGDYHHFMIDITATIQVDTGAVFSCFGSLEIGPNAILEVGKRVFFNEHCSVRCNDKISKGKDTAFGDGVRIYDSNHLYDAYHFEKGSLNSAPVSIGKNCWIGANVVILRGVTIGDNVIVGVNCLIRQDIPANSIVTSKESLIIKPRLQTPYHTFTLTSSDTLEHLAYLAEQLPEVTFHIGAPSNISPYLESFRSKDNIAIYSNMRADDLVLDLLEKSDFYLDINHWQEVGTIVEQAHANNLPIFAFAQVVHQPQLSNNFSSQEPQHMVKVIKDYLKSLERNLERRL